MPVRVGSPPVPGGVHLQKVAKTTAARRYKCMISGPFFTCRRRCALAEGCKNEPQHAGISACISGSVLHLSPEVCTCRRLRKRTAARRYKCMHLGVRSSPVPGGVHLQKAAKASRSTQLYVHASRGPFFTCPRRCALAEGCKNEPQHAGIRACILGSVLHLSPEVCTCRRLQKMHASQGPFSTCPRRCALAEGCKNEPQHAGISACISGSVLHLSPEVCTCRRLLKRAAARRYTCMHLGVRSSPVPGGVRLQKAATTNRSTQV